MDNIIKKLLNFSCDNIVSENIWIHNFQALENNADKTGVYLWKHFDSFEKCVCSMDRKST